MSEQNSEQHIDIKFCAKLGKSASESLDTLRMAYGDTALKESSGFEWHKTFKEGQENMKDDKRPRQQKLNEAVKMWKECSNQFGLTGD
jgi:hypothetical protein